MISYIIYCYKLKKKIYTLKFFRILCLYANTGEVYDIDRSFGSAYVTNIMVETRIIPSTRRFLSTSEKYIQLINPSHF